MAHSDDIYLLKALKYCDNFSFLTSAIEFYIKLFSFTVYCIDIVLRNPAFIFKLYQENAQDF